MVFKNRRKKAFIGTAIGLGASLVGGIIKGAKQKKANKLALAQQKEDKLIVEGNTKAQAMTDQYSNQDFVDEYKSKIVLKNGGKVSTKSSKPPGVRKKAEMGKLASGISGAAGGVTELASAIFTKIPKPVSQVGPMGFSSLGRVMDRKNAQPAQTPNQPPSVPSVMMDDDEELLQKPKIAKMGTKKRVRSTQ